MIPFISSTVSFAPIYFLPYPTVFSCKHHSHNVKEWGIRIFEGGKKGAVRGSEE